MRQKRFQNRIAESRFSFVITALLCLLIWIGAGLTITAGGWDWRELLTSPTSGAAAPILVTFPCMVLSTYLMIELNNTNVLIRIYSRMVSCTFLVLTTMVTFHFTSVRAAVVTLCAVGFYTATFHCYQDSHATGWIYHAFLCIGIASLCFVQVFFFLPLLWFLMTTKFLSMSLKTFCASLLGLITPYWFLAGYDLWANDMESFASHFTDMAVFSPLFDYSMLHENQVFTGIFLLLIAFTGIIHYLRNRQNDRIRTQMLYETFIIVDIATILFLLLQPQHYEVLLGIIIVNTSPLIAHFIALTQTRWTNLATKVLMAVAFLLTVYNLWMPSLLF